MGQDSVVTVYKEVIEEVLKSIQNDLIQEYGENAFNALKQLWLNSLIEKNVLNSTNEFHELQMQIPHMHPHHLPQPFNPQMMHPGLHALAAMPHQQLPPGMHPTVHTQHLYGNMPHAPQSYPGYPEMYAQTRPPSAASLASMVHSTHPNMQNSMIGRPRPQLPQNMQNRQNMPQIDGHFDEQIEQSQPQLQEQADTQIKNQIENSSFEIEFEIPKHLSKSKKSKLMTIPQVDGEGDDEDEEGGGEEGESDQENEGGNEESLNSSLDSSDEEDQEVQNLVVCLYDKVTRAKTKWRCVLKEGVMHLDRKDHVFQKATGEFEW